MADTVYGSMREIAASLTRQREEAILGFFGVETAEEAVAQAEAFEASGYRVVVEEEVVETPTGSWDEGCRTIRTERTLRMRLEPITEEKSHA